MDNVKVTDQPLNITDITASVTSPTSGAVSLFIGTTRNNFEGKTVTRLEYEAYTPMAEHEMKKICRLIREKWSVEHIAIIHRIGEVPIKEASVIIAISSPHRQESLEAVQYAIDTLKATVPIWKKEFYHNEVPKWKENKECFWSK